MLVAVNSPKMTWKLNLLAFLFILSTDGLHAQLRTAEPADKAPLLLHHQTTPSFLLTRPAQTAPQSSRPSYLELRRELLTTSQNLPQYCVEDLAFFCRLEVRMEKATRIPVRFRLGDVQYVDYLEGKIDALQLNY